MKLLLTPAAALVMGLATSAYAKNDIVDLETPSRFPDIGLISADGKVVSALMIPPSGSEFQVYRVSSKGGTRQHLGSLKANNSGESRIAAISYDGQVIVGKSQTDDNSVRAFRINSGDSKMTDLGTLRPDNTGWSEATGVSDDGNVVVGAAQIDSATHQAFRITKDQSKMTTLGSLRNDNAGNSYALAISGDGSMVVGYSDTDNLVIQAFKMGHKDSKMTAMGTLKQDNSGTSKAIAVSRDGLVITGMADTDNGFYQVFRMTEGDSDMTGLGTLKTDKTGQSSATAISADGRVIIGYADTDNLEKQAFRVNDNTDTMQSLGSLRKDQSGESSALAVSADGYAVVGKAATDNNEMQAFLITEDDSKMRSLGTLKHDNSGNSSAVSISAKGWVIYGYAETDDGAMHDVVWKVGPLTIVDRDNSHQAMTNTAYQGFKVLDLYQSALYSLANSRCQIAESDYCLGLFSDYDSVNRHLRVATGLFGAFRLPVENWTVGASLNFASDTRLARGYDTRGSHQPGVGAFVRYQSNKDASGLSIEGSGALLNQNINIRREQLANTEAGEGESRIEARQFALTTRYGINLADSTQIAPLLAIKHHNVTRQGYNERSHAEFPATYGQLSNKTTEMQLGADARHALTPALSVDAGLGAHITLSEQRDAFTGNIDHIGAYTYQQGDTQEVKPYLYSGVNVAVTENSTIRASAGWQKTDYRNDALQVAMGYSLHW